MHKSNLLNTKWVYSDGAKPEYWVIFRSILVADVLAPCMASSIRIESDKTTSIYNVSTRVLSKK